MPFFTIIKNNLQQRIIGEHDKNVDGVLVTAQEQVESTLLENETLILGAYPSTEFKISSGLPVELSQSEFDSLNNTPTYGADTLINEFSNDLRISGVATKTSLPNSADWTKDDAKGAIDQAAGRARFRMASDGVFVDVEYVQAGDAVKVWRAAGSVTDDIPDELQCWVDASGMTLENAALDIEANTAGFRSLIALIRRKRLIGKAAVDAEHTSYIATAQTYIEQLDAL